MEFSRQEYTGGKGLPFLSPGDLLNPGIEPGSPALQADSLLSEPQGKGSHRSCQVTKGNDTVGYVIWGVLKLVLASSEKGQGPAGPR